LYRKFTAQTIFDGFKILPPNTVLITSPTGTIIDIVNKANAGDDIEYIPGMLCPGFINAHCHTELSHLKGKIPTGTGLVSFVQQVIRNRFLYSIQEKITAAQAAITEMVQDGIVAVGDICNTSDTATIKNDNTLLWHNFIEISGFNPAYAIKKIAEASLIAQAFGYTNTSISPHAPYSVSDALFTQINSATANKIISIHNQECAAEDDLFKNKSGAFLTLYKNLGINIDFFTATNATSLQSFLPFITAQQQLILVHNTYCTQQDIEAANNSIALQKVKAIFYCLCINANIYIEQKNPPIQLLMHNNCNIVLGTDSYASNHALSIANEIKAIQMQTNNSIPLTTILQWATSNGAKALQLFNVLGSFEKGKTPGIISLQVQANILQSVARIL
jgi:aminodeoxyfutalosine deaminase